MDGEHTGRGIDLLRLPAGRFLNVVYYEMRRRIEPDPKGVRDWHAEFNNEYGVDGWPTPTRPAPKRAAREPGAPTWWHGEEEAANAFLRSMGVH